MPILHQLQEGMGSTQAIILDAGVGVIAGGVVLALKKASSQLLRLIRN
ncbi:MAG: hypothetical protein ACK5W9_07750 [Bdellovibrionales bacterium]